MTGTNNSNYFPNTRLFWAIRNRDNYVLRMRNLSPCGLDMPAARRWVEWVDARRDHFRAAIEEAREEK